MFYKKINGVNIIHYNPSPLEQIQSAINARAIRARLQKELPVKPKKGVKQAYREFLEVAEKYDLIKQLEDKGEL